MTLYQEIKETGAQLNAFDYRTGVGPDSHVLRPERRPRQGGAEVSYEPRRVGHSYGYVPVHPPYVCTGGSGQPKLGARWDVHMGDNSSKFP